MNKNLTFEINPNHELIIKLNQTRKINPKFASMLLRQLLDNTMITAGILTDIKQFINRINKIIVHSLDNEISPNSIENESSGAFREEIEGSHSTSSVIEESHNTNSVIEESHNTSVIDEAKEETVKEDASFAEIVFDKDGNPEVKRK